LSARRTVDVSGLPTFAFGHHQLTWWATWSLIFMEGTMFVVFFITYFFLRTTVPDWPPGLKPPELFWGTVNLFIFLASAVPAHLTKKAAEELDLRRSRLLVRCFDRSRLSAVMRHTMSERDQGREQQRRENPP
jgi:hypothetical protein